MNLAEFRALSPRRRNASPEHDFQCDVVRWLLEREATGRLFVFDWTASAAGVRVTPHVAKKMKAAGVRAGWPDLQFALVGGRTAYIELKAGASLSPLQRQFRLWAEPKGLWALARTIEQVETALIGWGALTPDPVALAAAEAA